MVSWLVGMSLKYRYLVVIIALVVIIVGVILLRNMPVDLFPVDSQFFLSTSVSLI